MGRFVSLHAITRAILNRRGADVRLYLLPLQVHPLHSAWPYASPRGFVKDAWSSCGPFLTLGWAQDTTALEEGCITDQQFLDLCQSIFHARERLLMHELKQFDEGVLAIVFDSLDRIQHMFLRDRPDIVEHWYERQDSLLGRVEDTLRTLGQEGVRIMLVSDHGFAPFRYKVNLNRWLVERGYLAPRGGATALRMESVDWSGSRAYALGLNSIYLNVKGREGRGVVPAGEANSVALQVAGELRAWHGPDGSPVVRRAIRRQDAFAGPLTEYGPDLVVGYSRGYRASSETGLGNWRESAIETNRDHWGADHCMDAVVVPGVLLCNEGLPASASLSYRDFPGLALGTELDPGRPAAPPSFDREDQDIIEERLRGLGYL